MDAVESVRIAEEISRRLRGASDAGKLRDPVRLQCKLEASLNDGGADGIVAATRTERGHGALVVAPGVAELVGRELRGMQFGLGEIAHGVAAFRSGGTV